MSAPTENVAHNKSSHLVQSRKEVLGSDSVSSFVENGVQILGSFLISFEEREEDGDLRDRVERWDRKRGLAESLTNKLLSRKTHLLRCGQKRRVQLRWP